MAIAETAFLADDFCILQEHWLFYFAVNRKLRNAARVEPLPYILYCSNIVGIGLFYDEKLNFANPYCGKYKEDYYAYEFSVTFFMRVAFGRGSQKGWPARPDWYACYGDTLRPLCAEFT